MAKVWELRNGRCYCYGHLAPDRGCDGPNCRKCCYNLGKTESTAGYTPGKLTLAQYNTLPEEVKLAVRGGEDGYTPLEDHIKIISLLKVEKSNAYLDPQGEKRRITINGDVGAVFTLTIKDSSGCSILKEEMENFKMTNHTFHFDQKFPPIASALTSETYTINVIPAADTILKPKELVEILPILYQYKNPTVTITNASTQTGPALGKTGNNITKTGIAGTNTSDIPGYTSTYTLNITEAPSTAGYFYIKGNPRFADNITSSTLIKKIIKRDNVNDRSSISTLKCLQPAPAVSDGTTVSNSYAGEVTGGKWEGKVSYTKTVFSSLEATDGTKINSCNDATDRFKLENTDKLFKGMTVTGVSNGEYIKDKIVKVWDDKLTLESKHVIRKNTVLTFEYKENGVMGTYTTLPHNTVIEIENNKTIVKGNMRISGGGTDTLTITTLVNFVKFGKEDTTYTLDLDNFIVRKPNAYDQEVTVKKDTATPINVILKDKDSNATSKTTTITSGPYKGSTAIDGEKDTITYTPNTGFTGEDSIKFTMSDGTNSSDEKTIFITVN